MIKIKTIIHFTQINSYGRYFKLDNQHSLNFLLSYKVIRLQLLNEYLNY